MNSTLDPQASTVDDVLAVRADERLAHAYEQIVRADEQLVRVTEQLSRLENRGARRPAGSQPSSGRPLVRGLTGLVLAAFICAAAFAAQSPDGEAARQMIAQWAPNFLSTSPMPSGTPGTAAQPIQSSVRLAAAETSASQATAALQTPAQDVAPAPVPLPPELIQLLQSMAHDIAVVEQEIEQLKASQERMFADNAKAIEQVRTSQEQLAALAAKPSERDLRARTPPPQQPATIANAGRKPAPTQAPQVRARPQPTQLRPDAR